MCEQFVIVSKRVQVERERKKARREDTWEGKGTFKVDNINYRCQRT